MSHKYGDAVLLVQKSRDGNVRRVNAIVLGSRDRSPTSADQKILEVDGVALPEEEHLDLVYPDPGLVPEGQMLTTRDVDSIFRKTYETRAWTEDAWIGFEEGAQEQLAHARKAISDMNAGIAVLRQQLAETTEGRDEALQQLADQGKRKPSAADLDADAAEKKAAKDTKGK